MNFSILNNFSLFSSSPKEPKKLPLTEGECVLQWINYSVYLRDQAVKEYSLGILEALEYVREFALEKQNDTEILKDAYTRERVDPFVQFEDLKEYWAVPWKIEDLEILNMTKDDVLNAVNTLIKGLNINP